MSPHFHPTLSGYSAPLLQRTRTRTKDVYKGHRNGVNTLGGGQTPTIFRDRVKGSKLSNVGIVGGVKNL
ncbi:MAG: hypothetical protein H0U72_00080 [Nitrosospira sp.]|nr:hypothetical protein [Nitrosospira sp.]